MGASSSDSEHFGQYEVHPHTECATCKSNRQRCRTPLQLLASPLNRGFARTGSLNERATVPQNAKQDAIGHATIVHGQRRFFVIRLPKSFSTPAAPRQCGGAKRAVALRSCVPAFLRFGVSVFRPRCQSEKISPSRWLTMRIISGSTICAAASSRVNQSRSRWWSSGHSSCTSSTRMRNMSTSRGEPNLS